MQSGNNLFMERQQNYGILSEIKLIEMESEIKIFIQLISFPYLYSADQ